MLKRNVETWTEFSAFDKNSHHVKIFVSDEKAMLCEKSGIKNFVLEHERSRFLTVNNEIEKICTFPDWKNNDSFAIGKRKNMLESVNDQLRWRTTVINIFDCELLSEKIDTTGILLGNF